VDNSKRLEISERPVLLSGLAQLDFPDFREIYLGCVCQLVPTKAFELSKGLEHSFLPLSLPAKPSRSFIVVKMSLIQVHFNHELQPLSQPCQLLLAPNIS
jgi:hypothetical protein